MIKGILRIWFFYLIVCLVIPPLYHKRADEENKECERALNMAGQETESIQLCTNPIDPDNKQP